jgi:hypothetical protein
MRGRTQGSGREAGDRFRPEPPTLVGTLRQRGHPRRGSLSRKPPENAARRCGDESCGFTGLNRRPILVDLHSSFARSRRSRNGVGFDLSGVRRPLFPESRRGATVDPAVDAWRPRSRPGARPALPVDGAGGKEPRGPTLQLRASSEPVTNYQFRTTPNVLATAFC